MATKQQDDRTETSNQERAERTVNVERPRRDVASWFPVGDWRTQSSADEWALA